MPPAASSPLMVSDRIRNLKFMQKAAPGSPTPSNASSPGSRYGGTPSSSRYAGTRDSPAKSKGGRGVKKEGNDGRASAGVGREDDSMDVSEDEKLATNGSANATGAEEEWTIPSSRSTSRSDINAQAGPSTPQAQRPNLGGFRISYETSYIPFITGGEGGDQGEKVMQQSVRGFEGEGGQGDRGRSEDNADSSDEDMDANSKPLLRPVKSTSTAKPKPSHRSSSSALPTPQFISGKFIFNPPPTPPTSRPSGSAQRPNGITAIKDEDDDDKPVEVRRNRKGEPLPMADARRKGPPNRTPGRFEEVKNLPPRPSEGVKGESANANGSGKGGFRKPAGFEDIPSRSTPTSTSKFKKRKFPQPDPHSSDEESADDNLILTAGAHASKKPKMAEKVKAKKQRQKEKKREKGRGRADEENEEEEESDPTDRLIDEFVRRIDEE